MAEPNSQISQEIAEQPVLLGQVSEFNRIGLAAARQLLQGRNLVRFLAIGSSRHAAGYGVEVFEALGAPPAVLLPAPGAGVPIPQWSANDVVVVVSQSGETPALLEAVRGARQAGAEVVAIINSAGSSLQALASVSLHCEAGAERVVAATKSVSTQMLLLRELAGPLSDHQRQRMVDAIEAAVKIDLAPVATRSTPAIVVCGGVGAGPVAEEIALKFAEVAGISVAAESLVEYLHGPIAARGLALALVEPSDPNAAALATKTDLIRIGAADSDILIPSIGDPTLDPLVRLVVGQRVAVLCAHALRRDPDSSGGLSKVTATI